MTFIRWPLSFSSIPPAVTFFQQQPSSSSAPLAVTFLWWHFSGGDFSLVAFLWCYPSYDSIPQSGHSFGSIPPAVTFLQQHSSSSDLVFLWCTLPKMAFLQW